MSTIGRFVTDPQGGGYCKIDLDSGQEIMVNHQKNVSRDSWLTIEVLKFMGFSSDRIFVCNLDSQEGKTALAELTRDADTGNALATPLGAFVAYVKDCRSVEEVKTKCMALMGRAPRER